MEEKSKETYDVHDNGGRPFRVEITKDLVAIRRQKPNNYEEYEEDAIVEFYNPVNVFVGRDPKEASYIGNSILVQNSSKTYTFIGWNIYQFSSEEQVIDYVSRVGNNDVPYPYAMTKSDIYLMIDGVKITRKEYEAVADQNRNDPYIYYYGKSGIGTNYDQNELYPRI